MRSKAPRPGSTLDGFKASGGGSPMRVWLTDFHAPVFTFYSDGNHATVVGSNPRLVAIRDSFFGTITTGPLVPLPGDGNLNVVVTIA